MVVNVRNFGDVLMSRPAGREAFLMAKAYVFNELRETEAIVLDSWQGLHTPRLCRGNKGMQPASDTL